MNPGDDAAAQPSPTDRAPVAAPRPARTRRRWRWARRAVLGAVAARLLLWLLLQPLCDFGAGFVGLTVSWRSASLSLSHLSLHVEDVVVRDAEREGAPTLFTAQDVTLDLSTRALLRGAVHVVDVGVAGAEVTLRRAADGELLLPQRWQQDAVTLPEDEADEPAPLRFELPLRVDSARVHGLHVDYVDQAASPPLARAWTLDLDVADLGAKDRRAEAVVRLRAPHLCDDLHLRATLDQASGGADARFDLTVRGVRPDRFAWPERARALLGEADVVDAKLQGALSLRALPTAPRAPVIEGRATLEVELDGAAGAALNATFGPSDPTAAGLAAPLSLHLTAPGLLDELTIEQGRVAVHDERVAVAGSLRTRGLTGARLGRELGAAGLEVSDEGLSLRADVDAEFGPSTTVTLERLEVRGSDGDALALAKLAVRDLRAADDGLAAESVQLIGPKAALTRTPDGALAAAGLRLTPRPRSEPPGAQAAAQPPLPQLRLGAFSWSGADLTLIDRRGAAPVTLAVTDVDVRADGLAFGVDAPPGRAQFQLRAPGLAQRLQGTLALAPRAAGWTAALSAQAEGVTLDALRPWLKDAGLEDALEDGALRLLAEVDVDLDAAGPRVRAQLTDVALTDGATRWLSLAAARADGLSLGTDALDLGDWELDQPFIRLQQDASPGWLAFGLRFGAAAAAAPSPEAPPAGPSSKRRLRHGPLKVTGGQLAWSNALAPASARAVRVDLTIGADDGSGGPVTLAGAARLEGAAAELRVDGSVQRDAARVSTSGAVQAEGLVGAELASLLPEGVRCVLEDGALTASFQADLAQSGAPRVAASLRDLRVTDRGEEVAAIAEATLRAPKLSRDEVHVEALRVRGVRGAVSLGEDGAFGVAGFSITSPAAAELPPAARTDAPRGRPAAVALPKLRVDAASFELERLAISARARAAAPVLVDARLALEQPFVGDPDQEEHVPARIRVEAGLAPLGAQLRLELDANPFELQPTLDARVSLQHLDMPGLLALAESLPLTGEARDLSVEATVHARLDLKRRDPRSFDLSSPFGAEVVFEDVLVEDTARPTPLLRAAAVDVVARAIDLASGDVLLRSVYLDDPELSLEKDEDGTHLLGVVVPRPTAETPAAPPPDSPPDAPAAELAIEHLHVTGLALDYVDRTSTPRSHLRLVDSDVEAGQLSTRAWSEPLPLTFTAALRGGDVELERRVHSSSVLGGLLTSGARALSGGRDEHDYELRPLLDQLSLEANLTLFPAVEGRVEADLDRLELGAFRGLAKAGGVDLTDGLYDARAAVDLKGLDGMRIQSEHVFTWLALQEPPNGPLTTYLRLPAPLQTVLFLLRDSNDQQRLPLNVTVPPGPGGRAAVVDAVVEGLAKLIGQSIGGAGARAASALTGALLGASDEVPDVTAQVAFAAGAPLPEPAELQLLVDALRADPQLQLVLSHLVGAGDLTRARELANPRPEVLVETIAELEQTRASLERTRAPIAQDVVALYAAGQVQQAIWRQDRLESLDTQQGEVLEALRVALEHLGNPGERAALRRTRRAALALAQARLDAVVQKLRAMAPELTRDRFDLRTGRAVPAAGLTAGGVVQAALRRRVAQGPEARGRR